MLRILIGFVLIILLASRCVGEVLIDTRFGPTNRAVPTDQPSSRITGVMNEPWSDNSTWAKATIRYSSLEEEGRGFLRVDLQKVETGHAQLRTALTDLKESAFYTLEIDSRSVDGVPLKVGIRQEGEPYDFAWQSEIACGDRFGKKRLDFELPALPRPMGVYLLVQQVGRVDIASVRLERVSREQMTQRIIGRSKAGGSKNQARNSVFPLGLPTGWNLAPTEHQHEPTIDVVPGENQPVALRVRGAKPFTIYSAPIALRDPSKKHTASVYFKGAGVVHVRVRSETQELSGVKLDISPTEWRRLISPFQPKLLGKWVILEINGTGELTMDRVQVEVGDWATEFQQPPQLSVRSVSPVDLSFDAEPLTVEIASIGFPAGGAPMNVALLAPRADGGMNKLEDKLIGKPAALETVRFSDVSQLGSFRVEVRRGNIVTERVLHRVRKPRFAGVDGAVGNFGVHTDLTTAHLQMAKAVGANWVRLHDAGHFVTGWHWLEAARGQWNWSDAAVERIRGQHLSILGTLSTSPEWASFMDKPRNEYFDRFWLPRDQAAFENYIQQITSRYRGQIDAWDVWNEPWFSNWFSVSYDEVARRYVRPEKSPERFVEMTRAARRILAQTNPSATLVGLNSTTNSYESPTMMLGRVWTSGVRDAGGLADVDVLGFHMYDGSAALHPQDAVEAGMAEAVGPLGKIDKPVWMTEGQAAREIAGFGLLEATVPGADVEDTFRTSDRLVRQLIALKAAGVEKSFLYSMHSYQSLDNPSEWRALVCGDGSFHPSATAFSQMAYRLDGATFIGRAETQKCYVYRFARGKEVIAVVAPRELGRWLIGGPARAEDVFGNPPANGVMTGSTIFYIVGSERDVEVSQAALRAQ